MSTSTNPIGLARKQSVFAKLESVVGTMVFPSGTTDFIRPAGNAAISQNPAFVDSEELANTLDVLDQFQNATPAGKWNLVMYLRPTGAVGLTQYIQGNPLFRCLQGAVNAATTASLASNITAVSTTVLLKHIAGGTMPEVGVVTIGSEMIHYGGITRVSRSASTATLTGCMRAYDTTMAATAATNADVALSSQFYKQATTSPSFSLWIETDHFVQGLSGCSIDNCTFDVTNEGAVKCTMDGQGMNMVYAGSTTLKNNALATNTVIKVVDASLFTAGAYIYDSTAGTMVRLISSVDIANNRLTLSTTVQGATWASGHTIRGYLPQNPTEIGDPIESRDTSIKIDGVAAVIKSGSLAVKVPKKYLEDEIGNEYPIDYLEDKRDISSTMGLYFRKADAKYFTDGFAGEEVPVQITFGNVAGSIVDIYMKRCKLTVPTINYASPAVELSIPIKALGTVGEDSLEIVIR